MEKTDIGVNLGAKQFKDPEQILKNAQDSSVSRIITISNSLKECNLNLEFCKLYNTQYGLYSTIGIHPHNAKQVTASRLEIVKKLINENRGYVVAVGECGLDFNRNFSPPDIQKRWFEEQIQLAIEVDLPLYFHERDAFEDFYNIVQKYDLKGKGVVHCFTGSKEALSKYLSLGFYIGITGWVCDEKRGKELQKIVPLIPLDRLMLETDAPFLTPHNIKPRPKYNEPKYIGSVVKMVAGLYGISQEKLIKITTENAKRFFGLNKTNTSNNFE